MAPDGMRPVHTHLCALSETSVNLVSVRSPFMGLLRRCESRKSTTAVQLLHDPRDDRYHGRLG
jgi:hypothetical protein